MNVRPSGLILRCYAEKEGNQWQAFCLDLSLAAQASSFEEAKKKLERMILDYVREALVGQDRAHAGDLLPRRAPLVYWLKYYFLVSCKVGFILRHILHRKICRLFKEPLPLFAVAD